MSGLHMPSSPLKAASQPKGNCASETTRAHMPIQFRGNVELAVLDLLNDSSSTKVWLSRRVSCTIFRARELV